MNIFQKTQMLETIFKYGNNNKEEQARIQELLSVFYMKLNLLKGTQKITRRSKIRHLRDRGYTYSEIGATLNIPRGRAWHTLNA